MVVIYYIYSLYVAVLILFFSFFFVITSWWFLFLPKYKRLPLFTAMVTTPWFFITVRLILMVRSKIIGKSNIDKKRTALYICNHQSWVDVPLLTLTTTAIGLSKKEVRRIPLVGLLMIYSGGMVIVDRHDQSSRLAIIKDIMGVLKKGYSVFYFPEGTRSKNGQLLEPNKAIIKLCYKLKIPVVTSAIEGTRNILPPNRIYIKFLQKVILKINKPIYPENFDNDSDFADTCWEKVKETHEDILKEYF